MSPQPPLALDVATPHARRGLATIEWVRRWTGFDADTVLRWVDAGELVWIWDVSAIARRRAKVRELRFWPVEVAARGTDALAALQRRTLADVTTELLGARERVGGTELAQVLLVSRPHVLRLVRDRMLAGPLIGGKQWITRESAEKFLRARWIATADGKEAKA